MRPVGLKTYWLDDDEVTEEDYEGLSEAALLMLADDDEIEIREQSERGTSRHRVRQKST
jgi:hypothetical protein